MMVNKYKTFFFLFFYFVFTNTYPVENKIIVKVNEKVITSYELKNKILTSLVLSNQEINQENINISKPIALKSLIELKIKEIEIKKYKIKVTDFELNNNLKQLANNEIDNFKRKFKMNNLNYEIYKNDLKTELSWRKLIYLIYNKKVEIDEAEIDLQIKETLKNSENNNVEYRLTELLIDYESKKDKEEKIKQLNLEIDKIGFDNVLKKYNASINSNNLGDLGWVNAKSLSKNILMAVKNLKINDVSRPIIIGNKMLFLKLKDKRINSSELNEKDLKQSVINLKKNQRFLLYSNSHLSKAKNLALIEYK